MISVEDCVEMETMSLKVYVEKDNERLLKREEGEEILRDGKTQKEILEKRSLLKSNWIHDLWGKQTKSETRKPGTR